VSRVVATTQISATIVGVPFAIYIFGISGHHMRFAVAVAGVYAVLGIVSAWVVYYGLPVN
jgi:hypothetical protein